MSSQKSRKYQIAAFMLLVVILLASCQPATAVSTERPTSPVVMTATTPPTQPPTIAPTVAATSTNAPTSPPPAATQPPATSTPVENVTLKVENNPSLGDYLVDDKGNTVYRFTQDGPDQNNCSGACATIWPPYLITGQPVAGPGVTGTIGTITLQDGSMMVTYNQMPLHYFSGDTKPGDTNGQGFGNIWFVVAP